MKKLILLLLISCAQTLSFAEDASKPQRALLAYLKVKPGAAVQFLKAAKNVITESRKEPGNLVYILQQSVNDPHQFVFYELFKSDADLELHRQSKHVVNFLNTIKPVLLPGQFILTKYDNVYSE